MTVAGCRKKSLARYEPAGDCVSQHGRVVRRQRRRDFRPGKLDVRMHESGQRTNCGDDDGAVRCVRRGRHPEKIVSDGPLPETGVVLLRSQQRFAEQALVIEQRKPVLGIQTFVAAMSIALWSNAAY